jgi:hypothetical protein
LGKASLQPSREVPAARQLNHISVRRQKEVPGLIEGEGTLQLLAEVSIAFAGFSGVVGVFGGGSALSEAERSFRVRMLIVTSLAAFFGSLLPLVLGEFEFLIPWVWTLCCPLMASFVAIISFSVHRQTGALASAGDYARPWFAPLVYVTNALLVIALLGAAVAILPGHSFYVATIVWYLALSSLHFLLLVVQTRPRSAV